MPFRQKIPIENIRGLIPKSRVKREKPRKGKTKTVLPEREILRAFEPLLASPFLNLSRLFASLKFEKFRNKFYDAQMERYSAKKLFALVWNNRQIVIKQDSAIKDKLKEALNVLVYWMNRMLNAKEKRKLFMKPIKDVVEEKRIKRHLREIKRGE